MRLGLMSVARMLPDTSIARMIVSCCDGSLITASGRDTANISTSSARPSSSGGTWRRQPGPLPSACLTSATLAKRTVLFLRRCSSHRYSSTSSGAITAAAQSASGHRNFMVRFSRDGRRRATQMRRHVGATALARALAAQRYEAQQRFEQVVVGGQLERVDLRTAECSAQVGLVLCGQRLEAGAERRVVGVDEQLLTALGIFQRDQPDV